MLRDHILSSLLQYFGSPGQPFPLLGEGSRRRPWQRNAAWASCCALGWSATPGLEVVFGLLRTGKQFSDKEHHFSSWGEPKCRGVSSEPYPVSPESRCPLANPCLLLQLGYSYSQASQEFQIFRRCPSWVLEVFFSSNSIKHHLPQIGNRPPCAVQNCTDHGSFLLCPAWFPTSCLASNALQLTLKETSQNPSYPRSNPWRAGLANGKQLQLLMLSRGIWALTVKIPGSGPVDRL